MNRVAIIDGDNLAITCAASGEEFPNPGIACARADQMIEGLMIDTNAEDCAIILSGPVNFRKSVYPEYKANRIGKPRPRYEHEVKAYLEKHWQATRTDGIEADDQMGILYNSVQNAVLVHLDKDINQIAGYHFNWEIRRHGEIVREKRLYNVTSYEANRFFWYQLIVGDNNTDNIKGVQGMGPKKADAFLDSTPAEEWYQGILDMYGSEEEMDMNAQCVYIHRKVNDNWRNIIHETVSKSN